MPANIRKMLVAAAVMVAATPSAFANVITDWDEKAIAAVAPMSSLGGTNPYLAQRMMALVHVAMFDAVLISTQTNTHRKLGKPCSSKYLLNSIRTFCISFNTHQQSGLGTLTLRQRLHG